MGGKSNKINPGFGTAREIKSEFQEKCKTSIQALRKGKINRARGPRKARKIAPGDLYSTPGNHGYRNRPFGNLKNM